MKKIKYLMMGIVSASIYSDNYTYYIDIAESDVDMAEKLDPDTSLLDFMTEIISIESDYYLTAQVSYKADHTIQNVYLTVIDNTNISQIDFLMPGINWTSGNSYFSTYNANNINSKGFTIVYDSTDVYSQSSYQNFLFCYRDGLNCNFTLNGAFSNYDFRYGRSNIFNGRQDFIITPQSGYSYNIFLYSTIDLIYTKQGNHYPCTTNNFTCYVKNLNINTIPINEGDNVPTYYDLFRPDPTPTPSTFDDYSNQLGYVYGSNISKANLSTYKVNIDFNFYDPLFIDSLEVVSYFTGRVDNGDYYSYESIDCSPVGGDYLSLTSTGNKATGYIFPNGITCTSSLTNYDSIYYRLDILPFYGALDDDGGVNPTTFNLHLSANHGIIDNINYKPKYFIRDYFSGLSNTFGMVLSTNAKYAYTSWYSPNNSTLFESAIDRPDNQAMMFDGGHLYIGSGTNLNKFIFNDPRYYTGTTDIYLYLDNNVIVSISDNDSYSYYDDSNTLTSGTVTKNYYSIPKDDPSYDISYYFGLVNSYIDSISLDIYDLSTVIQEGYDLIPEPFSTLILIFFILSCMGLIFKLIKEN